MALFKGNKSRDDGAAVAVAEVAPRGKLHDARDAVVAAEQAFADANAELARLHGLIRDNEQRIEILTMTATPENAAELAQLRAMLDAYRRQHAVKSSGIDGVARQLWSSREHVAFVEATTRQARARLAAAVAQQPHDVAEAEHLRARAANIEQTAQRAVDSARAELVALTGATE